MRQGTANAGIKWCTGLQRCQQGIRLCQPTSINQPPGTFQSDLRLMPVLLPDPSVNSIGGNGFFQIVELFARFPVTPHHGQSLTGPDAVLKIIRITIHPFPGPLFPGSIIKCQGLFGLSQPENSTGRRFGYPEWNVICYCCQGPVLVQTPLIVLMKRQRHYLIKQFPALKWR